MRTTIDLEDDLLETARAIARAEGRPLGRVLSNLVRRGLAPPSRSIGRKDGFPVFDVDADAAAITPEMVRRALEE